MGQCLRKWYRRLEGSNIQQQFTGTLALLPIFGSLEIRAYVVVDTDISAVKYKQSESSQSGVILVRTTNK